MISFTLMSAVLNLASVHREKEIVTGAVIGGVVTFAALVAGPITGASMNPARSLGPAIAAQNFESAWLYILAPVLGMLLAIPVCRLIQEPEFYSAKGKKNDT